MKHTPAILLSIISVGILVFAGSIAYPKLFSSQQAAIASAQTATDFTFKQSTLTVQEGSIAKITIVAPQTLTKTTRVPVRVLSGTAKSGTDFRTPTATTLTFYKGGLKEKTISISTIKDSRPEQSETFTVRLGTSGPQVTVTINDKSTTTSSTSQNPPVTCPSPYVYGYNKPITLISRPFSYIPWAPTTPYGGGVSFPGMASHSYGSMRGNDPAVIQLGTVEAYEFTMVPETWDGQEHTKILYQTKVQKPDGTYTFTYGQPGGKLTDGHFNVVASPQSIVIGGVSNEPGHSACFSAELYASLDECPGVIDPRRNPGTLATTYMYGAAGEGRLDWRPAGDKYFPGIENGETSYEMVPGKKYYLNMSYTWDVPPGAEHYEQGPKPGEQVYCGLRLIPRIHFN